MSQNLKNLSLIYPEARISGYTSVDGTIEFYARINSLINQPLIVLDFGAGRAAWNEDDPCAYRKQLRNMRGKVNRVIGCDVDDAVLSNNSVDEKVVIETGTGLPFDDGSIDLIICHYAFEHIKNPSEVADEFNRILKPGGWVCARTPNQFLYVSLMTRMSKNRYHAGLLKLAQPDRKEIDVFPTAFMLNSLKDISRYFSARHFYKHTSRY